MRDSKAIDRYHRQRILPCIGDAGQSALAHAHVVLIGIGALGCQVADLLVRAGVGRLTCIDRDVVELTNLQRQTLFCESDAAERLPKVQAAARRLAAINSQVQIHPIAADFSARNALELVRGDGQHSTANLLIDGTDNFETRYLINDISVKLGVPYIYGGVIGTRAMAMALGSTPEAPCLRCVFPEPPSPGSQPTCGSAGVLGAAVAAAAAWQVALATRVLTGQPPESVELHDGDLWRGSWRSIRVMRQADCPCCGPMPRFEFLDHHHEQPITLCGSGAFQVWPAAKGARLDLAQLATRLSAAGEVRSSPFMLRFVAGQDAVELSVFADGRAIVKGVDGVVAARSAYARYIGA
ncbi:MAG: ThiF family adenylyltransferase [Planctomycetota bacterium]|nr:ThiF family adenylyltransferase [Planctomycetota bacterium]